MRGYGEALSPNNYEQAPGRWEVLAVPQLVDPDSSMIPSNVLPTTEVLLPVWVPDGVDVDARAPIPSGIANAGKESDHHIKAEYLRYKFPPHRVAGESVDGYVPQSQRMSPRTGKPHDLGDGLEWVTVVFTMTPDGPLYEGLNDDEFQDRFGSPQDRHDASNAFILGESIRPTSPISTMLRESDSLLGLFGMQNEASAHVPARASAYSDGTA